MAKDKVAKPDFKYGIEDAAKHLGVKPATARGRFRRAGVKPTGSAYGWDSEKALKEDCEKTNAPVKAKRAKPAKKPTAKKAVKKEAPKLNKAA